MVDDSDINREVSSRIFAAEGAQISLASDGRQALDWLKEHVNEIDLVLMDVQMPVMDGYEATRAIRADAALAHLPVVALTAGAFIEMQAAAREAGMDDYIAKPFDVDAAIAMIQRLTNHPPAAAGTDSHITVAPLRNKTPETLENLPGIELKRGLAIWRDNAVYKRYLYKFSQDYADSVSLIAQATPTEGATFAHKLKGAAGSLALMEVAEAATAIDSTLREGKGDATTKALLVLQTALALTLKSIAFYASPDIVTMPPTAIDDVITQSLLNKILVALNADDPSFVEPLLKELRFHLPIEQLKVLTAAIDGFDFRGAETATLSIAAQLGLVLGKES